MCIAPNNKSIRDIDFLKFMNLIENRLSSHNQIMTSNKEMIIKILFEHNEHLSVQNIIDISKSNNDKKLDTTTIYRILSKLEIFGIVESILLSDNKRRYELSYLQKPHYHLSCQTCNTISEFESIYIYNIFLKELKNMNFQSTSFNVIINGVCKNCQE